MRNFVTTVLLAVLLSCGYTFASNVPDITSISEITTQQYQTITIKGSGFGSLNPYIGNSPYIVFYDQTKNWTAGNSTDNDWVTLIVSSWTDSKIILGGFSGYWGDYNWTLDNGDKISIGVLNPQSDNNQWAFKSAVVGASPVPEPGSLLTLGSGLLAAAGVIRRRLR